MKNFEFFPCEEPSSLTSWGKKRFGASYDALQKAIRKKWIFFGKNPTHDHEDSGGVFVARHWLDSLPKRHIETHESPQDLGLSQEWIKKISSWIIHEDHHMLVINKPSFLPCQGGSGQNCPWTTCWINF